MNRSQIRTKKDDTGYAEVWGSPNDMVKLLTQEPSCLLTVSMAHKNGGTLWEAMILENRHYHIVEESIC
jgi:hypothetical protein